MIPDNVRFPEKPAVEPMADIREQEVIGITIFLSLTTVFLNWIS